MRDFQETAKRILELVPADQAEFRGSIEHAISRNLYMAPEAQRESWAQLMHVFKHHFREHDPSGADDADWEREICAIMRGEK